MRQFILGWVLINLFFFVSCGLQRMQPEGLLDERFYVMSVSPAPETKVTELSYVEITFSQPVYEDTITQENVFIVSNEDYVKYVSQGWRALQKGIADEKVSLLPHHLEILGNNRVVRLILDDVFTELEYAVVVVPKVVSSDYFPLDQTFRGDVESYFYSTFMIVGQGDQGDSLIDESLAENETTEAINEEGADAGKDEGKEEVENEKEKENGSVTEVSSGSYPDILPVGQEIPVDEGTPPEEEKGSSEIEFDWQRVLITEIVTDPQQDHNETGTGNGIPFDGIPGDGTVGSTDEYIEIFNGTDTNIDISQWRIEMKDGTDEVQLFNEKGLAAYFSQDGTFASFASGEFLVLGNPKGSLNNSLNVELYDETDTLVDNVNVDDANANDLTDEAMFRDENGDWMQGTASPGEFF